MSAVWLACIALYLLLPFQLLERQLTWQGGFTLALFITTFIVGSMLLWGRKPWQPNAPLAIINSRRAERLLMAASALATVFFALDARGRDLFNLAAAYELRSETANALLKGEASGSSIWFQLAFLLYPAAYVFTAAHLIFAPRISKMKLLVFGLLPIGLASALMGGRMPVLYALLLAWLAFRERKNVGHVQDHPCANRNDAWRGRAAVGSTIIAVGALFYYFAAVFLVRAEAAGGVAQMFDGVEERWGVAFRGPLSDMLFGLLGEEVTYLVFIFSWYLVQGLVIANYLFSAYEGPAQFGVYGIDLVSAVMRRLDSDRLADGFDSLLTLGTYGFFPSAWGSLFVDFGYFGVLFCLAWGSFAGLAYQRIVRESRRDWFLVGPFVSAGIALSTINTPVGLANGFVTHVWMLLAFGMLRRQPARDPACAA